MKKYVIAVVVALVLYGGYRMGIPRGIRNKNPGNIRYHAANDWLGQVGKDDAGYAIFSDAKYGIRAMGKTLDSYQRRGVLTVEDIINTWAPPSENNTGAYLSHVLQLTGWPPGFIPIRAEGDYPTLVKAIIKHENGLQPYSDDFIAASLAIA